ncbi:hypothetical protein AAC387_Pa01g3206 [Persea americana]
MDQQIPLVSSLLADRFVVAREKSKLSRMSEPTSSKERKKIIAEDKLWDDYIAAHPRHNIYRHVRFKDYIHRVGRTARAGKSRIAISFSNQYTWQWIIEIENLIAWVQLG